MKLVIASARELPAGLALCVVVLTSEEVRAADWLDGYDDIPDEAYRALRRELNTDQLALPFGRATG